MPNHANFADNLRRKCAEFGSISDVCRATGINRQQFAKYLSGGTLPTATTLRKICRVLNIDEKNLLKETRSSPAVTAPLSAPPATVSQLGKLFGPHLTTEVDDLPAGWYHCYFPLPDKAKNVLRGLLVVTKKAGITEFARLTINPSFRGSAVPMVRGRHKGFILASRTEIFLLASNREPPHQISFMTISRSGGVGTGFYRGSISTKSGTTPYNAPFILSRIKDGMNKKEIIKGLHIVSEEELGMDFAWY